MLHIIYGKREKMPHTKKFIKAKVKEAKVKQNEKQPY